MRKLSRIRLRLNAITTTTTATTVVIGMLFAGCSIPGVVAGLNDEQLAALVKMREAGVLCIAGSGPPMMGQGIVVSANIDKGVKGVIEVSSGCEVKIVTN